MKSSGKVWPIIYNGRCDEVKEPHDRRVAKRMNGKANRRASNKEIKDRLSKDQQPSERSRGGA